MARPHVVIVGAGFGGLNAALGLARAPVDVTLVDQRNHHLFQPLLYQVATAGLSPAQIATPIRRIVAGQANARVLMETVSGIDADARLVLTGERRHPALRLPRDRHRRAPRLFRPRRMGEGRARPQDDRRRHSDPQPHPRRLRAGRGDRDEALRQALLTFVVVGGGPTGVELAGAIAELARKALARDFRSINASARQDSSSSRPEIACCRPSRKGCRIRRKRQLQAFGVEPLPRVGRDRMRRRRGRPGGRPEHRVPLCPLGGGGDGIAGRSLAGRCGGPRRAGRSRPRSQPAGPAGDLRHRRHGRRVGCRRPAGPRRCASGQADGPLCRRAPSAPASPMAGRRPSATWISATSRRSVARRPSPISVGLRSPASWPGCSGASRICGSWSASATAWWSS